MLSRVAGNFYWMARYLERAEDTARLVNVNSILLLDLPKKRTFGWAPLIAIMGNDQHFYHSYGEPDESNVVKFLLGESRNSSSILSCLAQARENMRTSRDIIPTEAWEQVNDLYLFVKDSLDEGVSKKDRFDFLKKVILGCQQITGITTDTMVRDAAYNFLRMGTYLERADMTSRILDVRSANLLSKEENLGVGSNLSIPSTQSMRMGSSYLEQTQTMTSSSQTMTSHRLANVSSKEDNPGISLSPFYNIQWMSVLKSLTAYQSYRRQVRLRVKGEDVLRFLLQDNEFPRSVSFCLNVLQECLSGLPKNATPLKEIAHLQHKAQLANVTQLVHQGLHQFIDELQIGFGQIHEKITANYFAVGI